MNLHAIKFNKLAARISDCFPLHMKIYTRTTTMLELISRMDITINACTALSQVFPEMKKRLLSVSLQ
jgi:hypothetical protein